MIESPAVYGLKRNNNDDGSVTLKWELPAGFKAANSRYVITYEGGTYILPMTQTKFVIPSEKEERTFNVEVRVEHFGKCRQNVDTKVSNTIRKGWENFQCRGEKRYICLTSTENYNFSGAKFWFIVRQNFFITSFLSSSFKKYQLCHISIKGLFYDLPGYS